MSQPASHPPAAARHRGPLDTSPDRPRSDDGGARPRGAAHSVVPGDADAPGPTSPGLVPPLSLGARVFGTAVAALGVQCLTSGTPVSGLEPLPAWLSASPLPGYLTGVLLVGIGATLIVRPRARAASLTLGAFVTCWFVLLQIPRLAMHLRNGSVWTGVFETAALGSSAWALAALSASPPFAAAAGPRAADPPRPGARWMARAGGVGFGVALCVFGVLHLVYHDIVASLVPGWIPGGQFWAFATGLAHLAAGASILTRRLAPLGATLVGAMFGLWVLIVHSPRVVAAPANRREWTSLCVALAMCGGAWIVARSTPRERLQSSSHRP